MKKNKRKQNHDWRALIENYNESLEFETDPTEDNEGSVIFEYHNYASDTSDDDADVELGKNQSTEVINEVSRTEMGLLNIKPTEEYENSNLKRLKNKIASIIESARGGEAIDQLERDFLIQFDISLLEIIQQSYNYDGIMEFIINEMEQELIILPRREAYEFMLKIPWPPDTESHRLKALAQKNPEMYEDIVSHWKDLDPNVDVVLCRMDRKTKHIRKLVVEQKPDKFKTLGGKLVKSKPEEERMKPGVDEDCGWLSEDIDHNLHQNYLSASDDEGVAFGLVCFDGTWIPSRFHENDPRSTTTTSDSDSDNASRKIPIHNMAPLNRQSQAKYQSRNLRNEILLENKRRLLVKKIAALVESSTTGLTIPKLEKDFRKTYRRNLNYQLRIVECSSIEDFLQEMMTSEINLNEKLVNGKYVNVIQCNFNAVTQHLQLDSRYNRGSKVMGDMKKTPFICRFYKQKFPKIGDVVVAQIVNVIQRKIHVKMLEYDVEFIFKNQVVFERVDAVKQLIGRTQCFTVIRTWENEGVIACNSDVHSEVILLTKERFAKAKSVNKMLCHVASQRGIKCYHCMEQVVDLFEKTAWHFNDKLGSNDACYDVFINAIKRPEILDECKINQGTKNALLVAIQMNEFRYWPNKIKARTDIIFKTTTFRSRQLNQLYSIRVDFTRRLSNNSEFPIEIDWITPFKCVISCNTTDPDLGLAVLHAAVQKVNWYIKYVGGSIRLKSEPKIVLDGPVDDADIVRSSGWKSISNDLFLKSVQSTF